MSPIMKHKRVELHAHLGSAVNPAVLWTIAHRQGIRLPTKDYWEFEKMITMEPGEKNKNLKEMHDKFFYWTELIQSSPEAIEQSVHSVLCGGYRKCNLVVQELRFNPMFRNRGGEKDLDHIIMAAIWGMERAKLEFPQIQAGLILMMDRNLSLKQNKIILEKAIKYKKAGIIGIDVAGPSNKNFNIEKFKSLFDRAKKFDLGCTIHSGEVGNLAELRYVVNEIKPDRIGHGILCVKDKKIMEQIVKNNITLEICPSSNLYNSVVKNIGELGRIIKTLKKNKIKFTINTDGSEMYDSSLFREQELLMKAKILNQKEINQCTGWALEASFCKRSSF